METGAPTTDQQIAAQIQRTNRSSFYILLLFFFLLFYNFSDNSSVRTGKPTKNDVLQDLQHEKELLNNLTFGVNVTNPLPISVEEPLKNLSSIAQVPNAHYYHNITGIFRGEWKNSNISVPEYVNKTEMEQARNTFEFDGPGSFTLNLKSIVTVERDVNYIEGYIRLKDADKSDNGALLLTGGVHFLKDGSLYMAVAPEGFAIALDDLLHMIPTKEALDVARNVLVEQVDKRIEELNQETYWGRQAIDDYSDPTDTPFACNFQLFGQLHPVPADIKMSDLTEYERELENPQGFPTIAPPPLLLSTEMYSPNCELLLSSRETGGIKIETYYNKAVMYAGIASVIAVIQIFSLIHQMEYTSTPSSVSNVSLWTIAMQLVMDGYLCLLYLTTGVVIENVFLPFATAAFFTFVLASIFGVRYMLVIWRIQRPESVRPSSPAPTAASSAPTAAATTARTANDTEDEATTANNGRTHEPELTFWFYRLYALLIFEFFIFFPSFIKSGYIQNIVVGILGFVFSSFWIPQIVRSVSRGCRHPLSHRYILVMSITRLSIPLFLYQNPENLLGLEQTPWVYVLVGYVALQVGVLFLQDTFGPRFFVPSRYLPPIYDYHPVLSVEDEETVEDLANNSLLPKDCAICMLPIDTDHHAHSSLNVLSRTNYMITPCHHMFHTECLQKWMRIKLECPVCRAYLPAC